LSEIFDPLKGQTAESLALTEEIQNVCGAAFELAFGLAMDDEDALEGMFDEGSELYKSAKGCLQTLLADNPVGNFIRFEYNNMDKILGCMSKLGENLPHCVMTAPALEGGEKVSLPLSLEKKIACMLGSSYETIFDEACVELYEGLDKCLPQKSAQRVDEDATSSCALEEGLPIGDWEFFGMDSSVVTGNKLPAFCDKTFDKKGMDTTEIQARFDHYNAIRDYGWTLESITSNAKTESNQAPEPSASASEAQSGPKVKGDEEEGFILSMNSSESLQEYKSNPQDISRAETTFDWAEGEETAVSQTESSAGESKLFVLVVPALAGVAVLALFANYVRSKAGRSSTPRDKYHVAMRMDIA